jgi:hypothetical protein
MLSFLIGESETSVSAAMVAMLCLCEDADVVLMVG